MFFLSAYGSDRLAAIERSLYRAPSVFAEAILVFGAISTPPNALSYFGEI